MPKRKFTFVPGEYYHIYNRGNSKQTIYHDQADHERFQALLYLTNGSSFFEFRKLQKDKMYEFDRGQQLVSIGAYCLMPNHFHILLTPVVEQGVELFMQKLSLGHTMYINNKYSRTGGLYEGAFKAELIDSDEYLKYLYSYIHLNPVKLIQSDWKEKGILNADEAIQYLEKYKYSSFSEYNRKISRDLSSANIVERKEASILNKEAFPEYFKTQEDFRKEIFGWIRFNPKAPLELA